MSERVVSLAVIGAGPAGLSAAAQAAKLGIDTVVIDMHAQAGGHYFSLPPDELQHFQPGKDSGEGKSLIMQAENAGAEILTGVEVWGIYPEDLYRICLSGGEQKEFRARKIILAPGATERIWPFPGWTLPGVITAGGALSLVKNQGILPGRQILVSGTGPLQLALAAKLASSGANVIAVLELQPARSLFGRWRSMISTLGQYQRLWEGLTYLLTLRSHKIPYRMGSAVIRALGEEEVTGAIIARLDADGWPIPGSERTIQTDCICLGYGLLPDTQFTRLLECNHFLHPQLHGWIPVRNAWLETSLPGVFSVGDGSDVTGKAAAVLEGKIAALAVAVQLEALGDDQAHRLAEPLQRKLVKERRFAQTLHESFNLPTDPCTLVHPDTVICRCECIKHAQVLEAIRNGATSVQAVKYYARPGMGWCRGVTCAPLISQIISQQCGVSLVEASQASIRPPLFPVALEELLDHEG